MTWVNDFITYSKESLDDRVREAYWTRGVSEIQISEFNLGCTLSGLPSSISLPDDFVRKYKGTSILDDSFVFPLTNPLGEVLGIQFRSIDRGLKEYSDYFLTRSEPALLGLSQAIPYVWESNTIGLVEGAFDLFPVQRIFPYMITTITSTITDVFARWLSRLVKRVILFYDNDSPGRVATRDFKKSYGDRFKITSLEYPRGVRLPNGKFVKDPADLWEVWGDEKLSPFLKNQVKE